MVVVRNGQQIGIASRKLRSDDRSRTQIKDADAVAVRRRGGNRQIYDLPQGIKDNVFGRTETQLIDDTSNPVGLDETDPNAKDDSVVATLVIPANRPVQLLLRSKDVTHSFWVPQLRFKQDLVPGMTIPVHFTAIKPGKYELACAELCGMNHYKMKSYMLVLPDNEFRELIAMPQNQFQTRKDELLNKYQLPQY